MKVGGRSKASLPTCTISFKKKMPWGRIIRHVLHRFQSSSDQGISKTMSRFGQNQQGTLRIWGVGALGESAQQFGMTWLWPKVSSDWHGYGTLFDWSANIFPWWRCQPKSYDLYVCITYVRVKYEDMNTPQAEFSVQTGDFQLSVKTDFCWVFRIHWYLDVIHQVLFSTMALALITNPRRWSPGGVCILDSKISAAKHALKSPNISMDVLTYI